MTLVVLIGGVGGPPGLLTVVFGTAPLLATSFLVASLVVVAGALAGGWLGFVGFAVLVASFAGSLGLCVCFVSVLGGLVWWQSHEHSSGDTI